MEHIYAVETAGELARCQSLVQAMLPALNGYVRLLREQYAVAALPRAVVWTSEKVATRLVSDIPLPGYTNEYRVVLCPDPEVWRALYLRQLEPYQAAAAADPDLAARCERVRAYYANELTQRHVLQILAMSWRTTAGCLRRTSTRRPRPTASWSCCSSGSMGTTRWRTLAAPPMRATTPASFMSIGAAFWPSRLWWSGTAAMCRPCSAPTTNGAGAAAASR